MAIRKTEIQQGQPRIVLQFPVVHHHIRPHPHPLMSHRQEIWNGAESVSVAYAHTCTGLDWTTLYRFVGGKTNIEGIHGERNNHRIHNPFPYNTTIAKEARTANHDTRT